MITTDELRKNTIALMKKGDIYQNKHDNSFVKIIDFNEEFINIQFVNNGLFTSIYTFYFDNFYRPYVHPIPPSLPDELFRL